MGEISTRKTHTALERFEVLGELGRGAASRILHIRDPKSLEHYAMKVVIRQRADEAKFLEQAKHEYEVAQKLDHPSLVKVHDIRVIRRWFREREVRTLMEYVNGETLEQIKSPPVQLLVLIFAQVADAVVHMHGRDVFHGDLKPNNIMVSRSAQVKVIDFGLAWLRGERKNRVQGTPGYLAPEQTRDRVVTEQTDVYNLGATMYRLLTGRAPSGAPAGGPNHFIAVKGLLSSAHEVNPRVPQPLSELVSRCCEAKPQKRPRNMREVVQALECIRSEMKVSADDLPEMLRRRRGD